MANEISIEKIRQALIQGNVAMKKRALAIVLNEAIVEADGLLEEFLGRETDPDLQALAMQVRKKLQGFKNESSQVASDKLGVLLESRDPAMRVLGLRALLSRISSDIPRLIHDCFSNETSVEALTLIVELLKRNPDPQNMVLLIRLANHPQEKIRMEAVEGIINLMHGCLYPHILKALLDPSPQIKMKAYQLISKMSRPNLLDSINFMFESSSPEISRLAGQLCPSFLGPDLIPMLRKFLTHKDKESAALAKRALFLMAQKGSAEAVSILETFSPTQTGASTPGETLAYLPEQVQKLVLQFPGFLIDPLMSNMASKSPNSISRAIHEAVERIVAFLNISFVCCYFNYGRRSDALNKACFRVLQSGTGSGDPSQVLPTLAPVFSQPVNAKDLFPFSLAHRLLNDLNDNLIEQILSFRETFEILRENPGEAPGFQKALFSGLENLLKAVLVIASNKIVVKSADATALKITDFGVLKPVPVDPKILGNFTLEINKPMLLSGDLGRGLDLSPFYGLTFSKSAMERKIPSENDLWDFLSRHKILDSFLEFLKQREF